MDNKCHQIIFYVNYDYNDNSKQWPLKYLFA